MENKIKMNYENYLNEEYQNTARSFRENHFRWSAEQRRAYNQHIVDCHIKYCVGAFALATFFEEELPLEEAKAMLDETVAKLEALLDLPVEDNA